MQFILCFDYFVSIIYIFSITIQNRRIILNELVNSQLFKGISSAFLYSNEHLIIIENSLINFILKKKN